MEITKVIFRMFNNEVIALFPEEVGDSSHYTCSSYLHVGQHGSADPSLTVQNSRPASPEQYEPLKTELEGMDYKLKVLKRIPSDSLNVRKQKLQEMEAIALTDPELLGKPVRLEFKNKGDRTWKKSSLHLPKLVRENCATMLELKAQEGWAEARWVLS